MLAWAACLIATAPAWAAPDPPHDPDGGNVLSIEGREFRLNGRPFDMWGIRVASASQSEDNMNELLDTLDDYKAYGVNTVNVYYQGSSGGAEDPFNADGTAIDPGYRARMERIIEECDRRGMVVVVGIFYQRVDGVGDGYEISGWPAAKQAVRTVTNRLEAKNYRNIILNIANEQNSGNYRGDPHERLRNVDDILELCRIAKEEDPDRLVGCGGYDDDKNERFALSPHTDCLLFDTAGPENSGELYDRWRKAGADKPMVNVEMFGGWTAQFLPPGVYPENGKREHTAEADRAADRDGLSMHFHSNPWCQGPSVGAPVRYRLGGWGTEDDPGIRWYFDHVRRLRGLPTPHSITP